MIEFIKRVLEDLRIKKIKRYYRKLYVRKGKK